MSKLIDYYNKFNEDKRLLSRHGQVEFNTTMHYIHKFAGKACGGRNASDIRIADIGAGTGRYSIALAKEGYSVTSVEYVKYNLGILKKHIKEDLPKEAKIEAFLGDALNLKKLKSDSYDIVLLMGPMYHLHGREELLKALHEAKRIVKKGGYILVQYVLSNYAVIKYGFMEGHIKDSLKEGRLTEDFKVVSSEDELYEYVSFEDIEFLNDAADLKQILKVSPEGMADYLRNELNSMDEETFELFKKYQLKICENPELVGAGSHLLDILSK